MKPSTITLIISLILSSGLSAQSTIESILTGIEKNNTTLSALRKTVEAEKIGNKTGIYLQNPEIEFNYLWGTPSVMGNRKDVNITQTFDFPTAYGHKNEISDLKNEQIELEYQKQRQSLLLQARTICIDLIYTNALNAELTKRLKHAQNIAKAYKLKFDAGETNILEYNKAQLNLLNAGNGLATAEIERNALLSELTRLNGGLAVDFTESEFQTPEIPADFEQWYATAEKNNPVLSWLKQEIDISMEQEKLNRAMSFPKLQTGYMSESVAGEQFQGVTLGVTIPLWENKNKVKYARANSIAMESIAADTKLQFYNQLKSLHAKAIDLQRNASDYRLNLQAFDNSALLKKALDKGELSLINYMTELSIYYESYSKLLDLERDIHKTVAELNQYN